MNLSTPPLQEPVSNTNPRWALWFSRIQALFLSIKTETASLDFGSINAAASADLTITVPGVVANDSVELGLPAAPTAGIVYQAFVSANDTVTVRATNITGSPINPAAQTFRVTVTHY
ncbi:MAG: hypothetical protein M0P21_12125 [Methanoculleus sp.]|jgi:hypothetical protein|nr:hypothetical protein [Methanoculleus sp.]